MSTVIMALGAAAAAVVALLLLRAAPRITVTLWLLVLFFVPVWVGVSVGPFWSAITLMTVLAIATCPGALELSPADGIMAAFAMIVVAQFALGLGDLSGTIIALTEWVLPYVWGRLVLSRVSIGFLARAIALFAGAAAILAVVESVTSTNVFVLIPGPVEITEVWAELQPRGGLIRVEGAFGHSIALGATLSASAAFVLAARWNLVVRLILLLVIAAAVVLTLSRIGLVTFVIAVALSILVLPGISRSTRLVVGASGVVAALLVVPYVSSVFLEAGQEAGGSADYRLDLLAIGPVLRPFGAAPDISGLTVNGEYLGFFARSIDNALMIAAMRLGWVPALLLLIVMGIAAIRILRARNASVAGIAVAAQIPGLFAVAFITQYSAFFWFTVGLAVALDVRRRRDPLSAHIRSTTIRDHDVSASFAPIRVGGPS